eukprot:TRINITY_DN5049_c0_g1_i1.p1 TRINITY_DN5049_c0_g1~~TRINITY_DN5049_c0_g1_i1.p1  ORF type:complete len:515 (-),score=215.13 TRINITY_DN5049_c0_g1_i1:375-1880(-)
MVNYSWRMRAFSGLILALFIHAVAAQPGFKTTLTQNGVNYLETVGIEFLQKALASLTVPDINGKTSSPIGTIDYSLTSITLSNTNLGNDAITIVPGTGLQLTLSNVGASAHLNWHYKMEDFPHTSDGGSADIAVSQTSATATISVVNQNGLPFVNCPSATVNVGHLDINLHGGASWLYQLFVNAFTGSIESSIASALHDAIVENINSGLNKAIKSLPISEPIDSKVEIDFPLVSNPVFASGYFSLPTLGEFYVIGAHTETPYPRPPIPDVVTSQMLQILITEYVVVSAGYVYWKLGELETTITQKDIPSNVPVQLNTTFFKAVLPQLYTTFPNMAMELDLAATQMPSCTFSSTGAAISVTGNIVVNVVQPNGTLTPAFTLTGPVSLAGVALLNGQVIYGNLSYLSADFTVSQSNIGPFSPSGLDTIINLLFEAGVVPQVNKILAKGFPLPTVTGLTFVNPTIGWGDHFLYVSTDVTYTPSFEDDAVKPAVPIIPRPRIVIA